MSKARTLADFISDGSEFADGTISVAEVSGAAPLASPTFTGTVTVPGITSTNNISLGDTNKLMVGSGNDLQILHNGANSYLDNFTGNLYISNYSDDRVIQLTGDDGTGAVAAYVVVNGADGTVSLNHYGSNKLITAADGVDITGDVGATTATITGKTTTDELDLNAIAATIADTAVDIFVYDTRKDSDGGAWRKRTQHTSWYNETLNTATRGSRKEFPAVAVIVAESNQVTIYDGDDPDLPMWMVFNVAGGATVVNMIGNQTGVGRSVAMLNGQLSVGADGAYTSTALHVVDFIADTGRSYTANTSYNGDWPSNISTRNTQQTFIANSAYIIVSVYVNDVAMTVLPNAPIDAATGLPVPTIAVATAGGVSVIKDDGTVVDYVGTSQPDPVTGVEFVDKDKLIIVNRYQATLHNLVSSDDTGQYYSQISSYITRITNTSSHYDATTPSVLGTSMPKNVVQTSDSTAAFAESGFGLANNWEDGGGNHLSAHATSSYNTGWMNGDIKLATLSDTDATNVTGSELVTNGTFDSDTSGWSAIRSASISIDSARLKVTNGASDNGGAQQAILDLPAGTYVVSVAYDHNSSNTQSYLQVGTASDGADLVNTTSGLISNTATGVLSGTFTLSATTTVYVQTQINAVNGANGLFDNVTLRLAEEDRSVNGNGLQVFGTVTKSAVATGADLVGYSGFSSSNYLAQPYNSDLDVGTGDFSFSIWAKANAFNSYNVLFANWWVNNTNAAQFTLETVGTKIWFYVVDGGAFHAAGGNTDLSVGVWNHITVTRRNSLMTVYINGVPESTTYRYTGDLIARTSPLSIGVLWSNTGPSGGAEGPWNGSLALFRMSATAPSPEQIKKIYEDEKVLFQDGAQATLYGSSDAVTALAYDDTTELLHVGTSAGRSVFQGLRRVDNTTTAVGAAISASNGLVADE